jgi:hypothetical protein
MDCAACLKPSPTRGGAANLATAPSLQVGRRWHRVRGGLLIDKAATYLANQRQRRERAYLKRRWGGRRDLNPRQPDSQSGALTKLSYDHHNRFVTLCFRGRPVKFGSFGIWPRRISAFPFVRWLPKVRRWSCSNIMRSSPR